MIRKCLSVLLIISLVFCLISCGSSSTKSNAPTITGKWVSDGQLLEITSNSFKFDTGDVWKYRIVNDYQIEITNGDGQTVVGEYVLSFDALSIRGSFGSITMKRDY